MTQFPLSGRHLLKCIPSILGFAMAASSWAAISVSDVSVAPKPSASSTLLIQYRLNEPASSVTINFSNGSSLAGTTNKGLNTVEYTPTVGGLTATITATAPAENGTGGASQIVPVITLNSNNPEGVAWFTRPDSPQRDHLAAISGYSVSTAGAKRLYLFAADGTSLVNAGTVMGKDISTFGGGSYPFGLAIGQKDPLDHVYVSNRTGATVQIFTPTVGPYDYTTIAYNGTATPPTGSTITGVSNTYTGLSVTPQDSTTTTAFNAWIADNKSGGVRLHKFDLSTPGPYTATGTTGIAQSGGFGTTNADIIQVAVDPTNKVLFKCQLDDGGVGTNANLAKTDPNDTSGLASTALQKWTSSDGGATWTADYTWGANVIGANGIANPATTGALGLALDKGFDANNLANSYIWVSVGGGTEHKIYHVRASDGTIVPGDTIDLTALTTSGTAIATLYPRKISVSRTGNIAVEVGGTGNPANATPYITVLAPNTTSPTTDTSTSFSVAVPLLVQEVKSSAPVVGNSGAAQVTYTVVVFDPSGIAADNVQVSMDLSLLKGNATQALTDAVSTDGKTGTFTYNYTIPADAPTGDSSLPVTITANGGKSVKSNITQTVYMAYKPNWTLTTDSGVNSSPAVAGKYAYVGTDGGSIYAFDAATGSPLASFGTGGSVNVGEPVKGNLLLSNGKLYAAGTAHVFIMDAGTGRNPTTGSTVAGAAPVSVAIANPSIALVPNSTDPIVANKLYVGSSDNKVRVLNATTGAQMKVSADLGAKIFRVAVGPTTAYDANGNTMGYIVVAGVDNYTDANSKVGGRIAMLNASDLTDAFPAATAPVIIDPKGAVKSKAAFGKDSNNANVFVIGGASGLWGVNADNGELLGNGDSAWSTSNTGSSAGENGNPYGTATPVDADPVFTRLISGADAAVYFATNGGALYGLNVNNGARLSFAGYPVSLPTTGGYAEGAGLLGNVAPLPGTTADVRSVYIGGDATEQKFFGLLANIDDSTYLALPSKKYIFDPADTLTFPASLGYAAGAFNSVPAMAAGTVVVGSAPATGAGKVYGFASINTAPVSVSGIDPVPGAWSVSSSKALKVTFNGDVNAAMVNTDTFRVYTASGTQVTGTVNQDTVDLRSFTFTPNTPWAANTTYYVVVSGTQDANNVTVQDFTSTFSTAAQPQPTVVKGDISGNGTFGPEDVSAALRIAAGIAQATQPQKQAGDLYNKNGTKTPDGVISLEDALFLDRVLNGKDTLP